MKKNIIFSIFIFIIMIPIYMEIITSFDYEYVADGFAFHMDINTTREIAYFYDRNKIISYDISNFPEMVFLNQVERNDITMRLRAGKDHLYILYQDSVEILFYNLRKLSKSIYCKNTKNILEYFPYFFVVQDSSVMLYKWNNDKINFEKIDNIKTNCFIKDAILNDSLFIYMTEQKVYLLLLSDSGIMDMDSFNIYDSYCKKLAKWKDYEVVGFV